MIKMDEKQQLELEIKKLEDEIKAKKMELSGKKSNGMLSVYRKNRFAHVHFGNDISFSYREMDPISTSLVAIAKTLFENYTATAEQRQFGGKRVTYYRDRRCGVKKLSELTEEQLKIAASMLDEMAEVYNKYYKALHQSVIVEFLNIPIRPCYPVRVKDDENENR